MMKINDPSGIMRLIALYLFFEAEDAPFRGVPIPPSHDQLDLIVEHSVKSAHEWTYNATAFSASLGEFAQAVLDKEPGKATVALSRLYKPLEDETQSQQLAGKLSLIESMVEIASEKARAMLSGMLVYLDLLDKDSKPSPELAAEYALGESAYYNGYLMRASQLLFDGETFEIPGAYLSACIEPTRTKGLHRWVWMMR